MKMYTITEQFLLEILSTEKTIENAIVCHKSMMTSNRYNSLKTGYVIFCLKAEKEYTIRDIARKTGISKSHVSDLCKIGELVYSKKLNKIQVFIDKGFKAKRKAKTAKTANKAKETETETNNTEHVDSNEALLTAIDKGKYDAILDSIIQCASLRKSNIIVKNVKDNSN